MGLKNPYAHGKERFEYEISMPSGSILPPYPYPFSFKTKTLKCCSSGQPFIQEPRVTARE